MNLLFNEPPLVISPTLAMEIGLNEAIILQQLHYWLQKSEHFYEGRRWIYNTYQQWVEQFPFWSEKTIKRTITSLESKGYVITGNFNKAGFDRTKWYSIDYDLLNRPKVLVSRPSGQNDPTSGSNCPDASGQNDPTYTRDYTETTTKTTTKKENKVKYADYVSMKEEEYTKLLSEFGEEDTKRLIEILNNYKGANGKRYKSDYLAIRNWVINRLQEEKRKAGVKVNAKSWRSYDDLYAGKDFGF
jgi:hypothetical protein